MIRPRPTASLAALLLAGTAPTQDRISLLEGAPGAWTLRELDESDLGGASRIVRRDLDVVPLEITNRTAQQELCADRPRLLARSGAPRVELPGGGRVLRYRLRGGEQWGFLLVTPRGSAVVLLELPGVGASGRDDPFADRFGVAPDGGHAAIATAAGGLYAVRLDGGVWASTQSPARLLALAAAVEPLAVTPGASFLFFVTDDDRIWRCPLADGGAPQDVTPPAAAGSTLEDELAPAGDGRSVAFLFGPKSAQRLWLLGEQGPALQLAPPPSEYEDPGYLPEVAQGPRLLLNDDGSRLFYIESAMREELFVLDTTGASATLHLTSDANFEPYIGVGILPMFASQTLLLAIGDPDAVDWYVAATGAGVTNLTRTTDRTAPPFGPGKLAPLTAGAVGGGVLLAAERQPDGKWALRRLDGAGGATSLLAGGLRAVPALGDALDTPPHVLVPSIAGDRLIDGGGATVLLSIPGLLLSADAVGAGSAFSVLQITLGTTSVPLAMLAGGPLLTLGAETGLAQLALTRAGGLLLNGATLRYFAPGRGATIATSGPARVVLSGAGA